MAAILPQIDFGGKLPLRQTAREHLSEEMRILCLTARLPYPPNRGDRLRAFHFIEHLSREHELSLVSFIAQESEREHLSSLKPYCQDIRVLLVSPLRSMMNGMLSLWRHEPLQTLYYHSNVMRRLVDQVLTGTSFDAAYVHLFRMAPYVIHHPELYRIVDLTDVISEEIDRSLPYRGLLSRLLYRLEKRRIVRYERWVAETFEETWLISDAGRRALAAACPKANIQVVTNGVDLERLRPTGQPCDPNSLIFVGHLRVFHNVDAAVHLARDILPLVRQRIPDCTLKIVGADPDARVRGLADDPAVTVTGFVPDLNAVLNQAAVFVAPLRFAAGVQNKVLEAMATGRPVVTTSVVNAGLDAQPDKELLVADDSETTVNQIVALLQSAQLRTRIGQAGRDFVWQKYTWDHAVKRMNAIEQSLVAQRDSAAGGQAL